MRLKTFIIGLVVIFVIFSSLANLVLLKTNENNKETIDFLKSQNESLTFDRQRLEVRCKILNDSLSKTGKFVNTTNQTFYFGNTKIKGVR